jgi:hypothetical protein
MPGDAAGPPAAVEVRQAITLLPAATGQRVSWAASGFGLGGRLLFACLPLHSSTVVPLNDGCGGAAEARASVDLQHCAVVEAPPHVFRAAAARRRRKRAFDHAIQEALEEMEDDRDDDQGGGCRPRDEDPGPCPQRQQPGLDSQRRGEAPTPTPPATRRYERGLGFCFRG